MDVVASIDMEREYMKDINTLSLKGGCSVVPGKKGFYLWERSFDGMMFSYDHVNATRDTKKENSPGS